ncbi:hypothetical protein [Cetobacterium sp.]|uniref:hypothetical protein n=1 Tax=Cetobacterium sp. TaxID=2071632 RepID=UPI003F2A9DCC
MKKIIISLFMLLFLIGCGEKVNFTTQEYKKELLEKVEQKDEKSIKEYNEIMNKLEKQAKNNKEAMEEFEKWKDEKKVMDMFKMSSEDEEMVKKVRETGKFW